MKIKKRLSVFLLCLLICLTGCTQNTASEQNTGVSCTALCEQLLDNAADLLECETLCGYQDQEFAEYFTYLYGIPPEYVSDGCILYTASGTSADEISLLQPADAGKGAYITQALQNRITQRIQDFTGYNNKEADKISRAQVTPIGTRIALVIADDPDAVIRSLRQQLKSVS